MPRPYILSDRETEILIQIASDLTISQIAASLFLSERTIISHREHIRHRLNVRNTPSAIIMAHQLQIINIDNIRLPLADPSTPLPRHHPHRLQNGSTRFLGQ
jgi:DNA-binding CsgD family transcriptional regulator